MLYGMKELEQIDPEIVRVMKHVGEGSVLDDFGNMDPQDLRAMCQLLCYPDAGLGPIGAVQNIAIPSSDNNVLTRLYYPEPPILDGRGYDSLWPVIVFFHGGGWVACGLDTHENLCRAISKACGALVCSVDYRLAPEYPFPAGLEDCYEAVLWMQGHAEQFGGDPRQLMVMGDSAGGNLAAVVSYLARERGGPDIQRQVMFYPATRWESWYVKGYLRDERDQLNPMVSPLLAESLETLPPATIVTAGVDGLNPQIEDYKTRLISSGVDVDSWHYPGMIHGFMTNFLHLADARDALARVATSIRAGRKT